MSTQKQTAQEDGRMGYLFDFRLNNKSYRVEVPEDAPHYVLSKQAAWGGYEKIPCMTDAEERAYPKAAAWVATAFLRGIKQAKESR